MVKKQGELEHDLSEMFGTSVDVQSSSGNTLGGIEVFECVLRIENRSSDNSYSSSRQSAIVLYASDLDVPAFTLHPQSTGLAKMIFSRLGGMGELRFDDTPAFSENYFLHGWAEEATRILFTPRVREYFENHPGWSVRGKGDCLVIFQANVIVDEANSEVFVSDALQILELLQVAESELDSRPEVRRETTADDMIAATSRMGGLVGMMLKNQLRKIGVTQSEVQAFLKETTPRNIPPGMNRQILGDTFVLIFVGLLLIVVGLILGPILFATLAPPMHWIGIPIAVFNPFFGGLILFFTLRHRTRKWRVLREGRLVQGTITDVKRTSITVNNQVRHKVSIAYEDQRKTQETTCNAYGTSATTASSLQKSGKQVNLLVDPKDPKHVVCTDLLVVFDKGF